MAAELGTESLVLEPPPLPPTWGQQEEQRFTTVDEVGFIDQQPPSAAATSDGYGEEVNSAKSPGDMEDGEVLEEGEISDEEPTVPPPATVVAICETPPLAPSITDAAPRPRKPSPSTTKTASSKSERKGGSNSKSSNSIEDFLRQKKERLHRKIKNQLETTGYRASKIDARERKETAALSVDTSERKSDAASSRTLPSPMTRHTSPPSKRSKSSKHPLESKQTPSADDNDTDTMMNSWMAGLRSKNQPPPGEFDQVVGEFDSNELFYNKDADIGELLSPDILLEPPMPPPPVSVSTSDARRPPSLHRTPSPSTDSSSRHDDETRKTDRDLRQPKTDKDYRSSTSSSHGDRDYRSKEGGVHDAAVSGDSFGDRDYRKERRRRRSGGSGGSDDDEERRMKRRRAGHYSPLPAPMPSMPSPPMTRYRGELLPHPSHPVAMMRKRDDPSYFGRSLCKFFREGFCRDGLNCTYSHDATLSRRRPELCKFYSQGFCKKTRECPFLHGEYPCKAFHKGECTKQQCPFSHQPLDSFTRPIYDQMLKDEELASRIAIPAVPTQRKVLLPSGPPPYELLEMVRAHEAKQRAVDDAAAAAQRSPGTTNGMSPSHGGDRRGTPNRLSEPPPTTAGATNYAPMPPPGLLPYPMPPMPPGFDPSQMPPMPPGAPPFFPPPFPPMPMPMPSAVSVSTSSTVPAPMNLTVPAGSIASVKEEEAEALNDDTPSNPTFSINEMLKKIQAQVHPNANRPEDSPASPPPPTPTEDVKPFAPQHIPQMGRPVYRLVLVDVSCSPNSNVDPSLLHASLSDTKLRNDPRIKKLLDSQFNAVSNMISSKSGNDAVSPVKQPSATVDPHPLKKVVAAPATVAPPIDPRKHRDPRLRKTENVVPPVGASVPKPSQASEDEIQKLVDLQLKMAAAISAAGGGGAGGSPRVAQPPTVAKLTDIPPPGLITPTISFGSGASLLKLESGGVDQPSPTTGSWMPQLGGGGGGREHEDSNGGGGNRWPSPSLGFDSDVDKQPLSMREKRKDNIYESPLNRDAAAGNDVTNRYNQMPNVRVRRKASPTHD